MGGYYLQPNHFQLPSQLWPEYDWLNVTDKYGDTRLSIEFSRQTNDGIVANVLADDNNRRVSLPLSLRQQSIETIDSNVCHFISFEECFH